MMSSRVPTILAAIVLGSTLSIGSAKAFSTDLIEGDPAIGLHDERVLGWDPSRVPAYGGCAASSAAEGNANQQTRLVKQYGQTSGGSRC